MQKVLSLKKIVNIFNFFVWIVKTNTKNLINLNYKQINTELRLISPKPNVSSAPSAVTKQYNNISLEQIGKDMLRHDQKTAILNIMSRLSGFLLC